MLEIWMQWRFYLLVNAFCEVHDDNNEPYLSERVLQTTGGSCRITSCIFFDGGWKLSDLTAAFCLRPLLLPPGLVYGTFQESWSSSRTSLMRIFAYDDTCGLFSAQWEAANHQASGRTAGCYRSIMFTADLMTLWSARISVCALLLSIIVHLTSAS